MESQCTKIDLLFISSSPVPGGGGGGGHSSYDWLRTRVQKKRRKGMLFSHTASSTFSLKYGCFFILHRTLGVPRNKI